jgi:hypothetical protein
MPLSVSSALAISAMGISETDSSAQSGQVTETLRLGSGIAVLLSDVAFESTIVAEQFLGHYEMQRKQNISNVASRASVARRRWRLSRQGDVMRAAVAVRARMVRDT